MGSDGCGRAVVSGAAGFIGSHLVDRMLEMGWEVVGIDNLLTGSRANLAHLAGHPRFRLVEQDVCQPVEIPGPVDRVLHLASAASPADFSRIPVEILMAGTVGTRNLLELAATKGARFLLASTSEVYGDPLVHPQPEDYRGNVDPTGPRGCYDEAKRCAEAFTMAYHRTRGVETRIVRIFNTYGPRTRVDDGRVVPNFALQALRRQPLTVYGDGSQTRSLCYVDDLVSGLLAVLESPEPTPFNLGTEQEITVLELARLVCQLSGSSSEITFRPLPPGDPLRRRPDLSKARRLLGWKAHVSLEEGLQRTLDHFRSILS
jgi:dTDP-glucose 4,6-dehydratase